MAENIVKPKKPLITVVDDMIGNLKVVGKILIGADYEVSMTQDSKKAIEIIEKNPPDLILLDIMMPFVNGYEVCEQIKSHETLKDIPVIFFTAKNETADMVKGFQVGGVDYIVKPANKEELLARVKTHLDLKKSKDIILNHQKELDRLFKEKSQFFDVALKNIIGPLEKVVEKAQYIQKMKGQISDREFDEQLDWIIRDSKNSFTTISDLYDVNYLDYRAEVEDVEISTFSIDDLIRDILVDYQYDIKRKRLILKFNDDDDDDDPMAGMGLEDNNLTGDKKSIRQILDNLISNAVKYSPFYKTIFIKTEDSFSGVEQITQFSIKDEGPGIKPEDKEKMFDKFTQLETPTTGKEATSGLGLYIVKRLCELIGGKVWVKSEVDKGSNFFVNFPKYPKVEE